MMLNKDRKHLCIIPAKGSSQRLPGKNKAMFNEKPLVVWAIETCLAANIFDLIYVSSDDDEILALAQAYPVKVVKRPENLSKDPAGVKDVCHYVIHGLEKQLLSFDAFSVVIPTSPLRTVEHLRGAWRLFCSDMIECVMSVTPLGHSPQRALAINSSGAVYPYFGMESMKMAQELEQLYMHDGTVLIADVEAFLKKNNFYNLSIIPYVIAADESVDVDTPLDLKWAEFLHQSSKVSMK